MKRPYLAPHNDGGSNDGDARSSTETSRAPWELSQPGRAVPRRPAPSGAVPPLPPDTPKAPEPPEAPDSTFSLAGDKLRADDFSKDEAKSFWSLPAMPAAAQPRPTPAQAAPPEAPLSGSGEDFDAATGWSFESIQVPDELLPSLSEEEQSQPILASADELFGEEAAAAVPAWLPDEEGDLPGDGGVTAAPAAAAEKSAPPPRPVTARADASTGAELAKALLARGREMLSSGETERAMRVLLRARSVDGSNPGVATWLEFGERRLLKQHCGDAKPTSIPTLEHPVDILLGDASNAEAQVLGHLDGTHTVSEILAEVSDDAYATTLKVMGAMAKKGWLRWR